MAAVFTKQAGKYREELLPRLKVMLELIVKIIIISIGREGVGGYFILTLEAA